MVRHQNGYLSRLVYPGVPYGSILSLLFFLIYINDLPDDLVSTVKLFADDTSLFSVHDSNISAIELNNNLQKISDWAYKWKMSFSPDLNKQAQELIFSRKLNKPSTVLIFWKMLQHFIAELMISSTLFCIYNIRIEQIGVEDTTIFNSTYFQKFFIKG